jgi:hypothetical protein
MPQFGLSGVDLAAGPTCELLLARTCDALKLVPTT